MTALNLSNAKFCPKCQEELWPLLLELDKLDANIDAIELMMKGKTSPMAGATLPYVYNDMVNDLMTGCKLANRILAACETCKHLAEL